DRGGQGGGDTNRYNGDRSALQRWLSSFVPTPASWTETLLSELPTLHLGMKDQAGHNQAIGKMKALIIYVGTDNNLPKSKALKADGIFDQATRDAVAEIQDFYGITGGNGECGERTWQHLLLGFG